MLLIKPNSLNSKMFEINGKPIGLSKDKKSFKNGKFFYGINYIYSNIFTSELIYQKYINFNRKIIRF